MTKALRSSSGLTTKQLEVMHDQFSDWRWRLNNLYWIIDKEGKRVQFRTNTAQEQFLNDLWYCNIILKARQLGFSTLIQLLMLDACIWFRNISCGTVAHTREDAEALFNDKAKYPYDQLPDQIRTMNPATNDSARHLSFQNNSSLSVGTSMRSKTLQYLHISEFGKLCARYPDKAQEVKTGALNTVQAGQMIFVESTAEGEEGDFANMCAKAMKSAAQRRPLNKMEFRFHFFPWFIDPSYRLPADSVPVSQAVQERIDRLVKRGIILDPEQIAWYAAKHDLLLSDTFSEFPSTPEEAFEAKNKGDFFDISNFRYYRSTPSHLVLYGASDYAITEKEHSEQDGSNMPDYTVHGVAGVDPNDDLYIIDWWRDKVDSFDGVKTAVEMMRDHKPMVWVEEKAQIEKALGPFIDRYMREKKVYQFRDQLPSNASKMAKAQSFRARQSMGKVYLPIDAPWLDDFLHELNTFGSVSCRYDDQVDVCGLFGRILDKMSSAQYPQKAPDPDKPLTFDELIAQDDEFRQSQRVRGRQGL